MLLVVEGRRVLPAVHASLARVVVGQNLRREVEVLGNPLGPEGAEIDRVDRVEAAPEDPVHQRHQLPGDVLLLPCNEASQSNNAIGRQSTKKVRFLRQNKNHYTSIAIPKIRF